MAGSGTYKASPPVDASQLTATRSNAVLTRLQGKVKSPMWSDGRNGPNRQDGCSTFRGTDRVTPPDLTHDIVAT